VFCFLLVLENDEPADPPAFVTAVPNWTVGETIWIGDGERFRILEIQTDIDDELVEQGFHGVFPVEPIVGAA